MLGLGVPRAWAALEAISAAYHGWPENVANCVTEYRTARVREVYVGIVPHSIEIFLEMTLLAPEKIVERSA